MTLFSKWAHAKLAADGEIKPALDILQRDSDAAIRKAAVGAGVLSSSTWAEPLADSALGGAEFLESLAGRSAFFRILADNGFRRVPMRTRIGVVSSGPVGHTPAEGKPLPVSKMTLSKSALQPIRAAAAVVVSQEVAADQSAASHTLVDQELRNAVSDAVDVEFFNRIVDSGTTVISSAGPDSFVADVRGLLAGVATGAGSRLYLIGASDVAKSASLLDDPRGEMTPLGGRLIGIPFIVSDAVPAGTLYLLDASRIAADALGIEVAVSTHAALEMLDAALVQDATTGTGTSLVSLWQTNSVGLLASTYIGVERLRADAVAGLDEISWGAPST